MNPAKDPEQTIVHFVPPPVLSLQRGGAVFQYPVQTPNLPPSHTASQVPAPSTESKRPEASRALGAQVHKVGRHGVEYGVLQAVVMLQWIRAASTGHWHGHCARARRVAQAV